MQYKYKTNIIYLTIFCGAFHSDKKILDDVLPLVYKCLIPFLVASNLTH